MKSFTRHLTALALVAASLGTAAAQWPADPKSDLVLGNRISGLSRISGASGIAVDESRGKIYISLESQHRVLRLSLPALLATSSTVVEAEAVLGQPDATSMAPRSGPAGLQSPAALALEPATGRLWVADRGNARIVRFDKAASKSTGSSADGVFGDGDLNNGPSSFYLGSGINGLAVDGFGNLYASSSINDAVFRFNNAAAKPNGAAPDAAFGQTSVSGTASGTSATLLLNPHGIALSGANGTSLWVVDRGNNRVLRFDNANTATNSAAGIPASAVLGQPDMVTGSSGSSMARLDTPTDIVVTSNSVFVSDGGNYRTLRYNTLTPAPNTAAVAWLRHWDGSIGSHGGMAFQASGNRLFAGGNSRVERYEAADTLLNNVNAPSYFGADPRTLISPADVAIDPVSGKVFVSDYGQNKGVARYSSYASLVNGALPEAWVCKLQPDFVATAGGGLVNAAGLCLDAQGRLWVADFGTSTVYRYDNAATMPAYSEATSYLGGASGTGANQMFMPMDVYADPQGRVWVADTGNHRVLRFDNAAAKAIGANANAVLGQTAFGSNTKGTTPSLANMNEPRSVVGDGKGAVWVADSANHRVLRFDSAASKANGANASAVLGQTSGATAFGNLGPNGLDRPEHLTIEGGNHLWVSEAGNKRVVRYKNAATLPNGAAADTVVGQPDFWHTDVQDDLSSFADPGGIVLDPSGRLYVVDTERYRVMRFSPSSVQIIAQGLTPQKQYWLTYASTSGVQYDVESSPDLSLWSYEATQTASGISTNFTTSTPVSGKKFFRVRQK